MSTTDNITRYLLDRRIEAGDADRVAVRCDGVSTTYADLLGQVAAVAQGLLGTGLRGGERVMLVCSDRQEMVVAVLATMRVGAVAVPVSTMLTGDELAKVMADSGARAVVVSPEYDHAVAVALVGAPEVAHVVSVGGAAPTVPDAVTVVPYVDLLATPADVSWCAATHGDMPALWLYTSGTTGTPKGAMHRHENLVAVCETYARSVLGITPDDVCFSVAKLFFAYGFGNSLLFPLSVGASTLLMPDRPSPQGVAERVLADRPTLFFAGPTFFAALLAADLPADTFASVRLSASAGEALPASLYQRFTSRFGFDVLDGIGSTEALHIFLSNHQGAVRPGTTGTAVEGYTLQIRDEETGGPVADGEPGVLYVRGESNAIGYWCRTDATREVFQGPWLRTGDTYVRSADGYFTCLGRSNDLLKAGGIWVSPGEVEQRLLEHEGVAQAAVVGVPDSNELDKPVAFVVPAPGAVVTGAELVAWCREGLAAFKRPRAVVLVDDLPKTATGKVQRFRLREMAGAGVLDAPPAQAPTASAAVQ